MTDSSSSNTTIPNPWASAALGTAVVTGIFSLILLTLLGVHYVRSQVLYPLQSERLELLKIQLAQHPNDESLLDDIRRLDVQVRQFSLSKTRFSQRLTVALFVAIVLFVVSLQYRLSLNPRLPAAAPGGDAGPALRQTYLARGVLAAVVLALAAVTLLYPGRTDPAGADDETIARYPDRAELDRHWVRFRGPAGAGISAYTNIPHTWNEAEQTHIVWKSPVPLPGFNSPIVWDNKIFLSGAEFPELKVFCYDLDTGALNWTSRVPCSAPEKVEVMEDTGYAAPTMVCNGVQVFAIFATGDIAGFDLDGTMRWHRSLGVPDSIYGYASSLTAYGTQVIVQFDQGTAEEAQSKLIALDAMTGSIQQQIPRPVAASWASPVIIDFPAAVGDTAVVTPQLLTVAEPFAIAYNPDDLSEIWRAKGIGADAAASPIRGGDYAICLSPYDQLLAIDPSGTGPRTDSHIAWTTYDGIPDICSPLSDGQRLYLMQTYGTLTCFDLADGRILWEHDFGTTFQASPSLVGDHLYLLGAEGTSFVIRSGPTYDPVSQSHLAEGAYASPAFVDGAMIVRTRGHLYRIGEGRP